MAKNSRLKRGGQLLGCMDAPAITGLAQAGRLYYAVAPHRRTAEFSSTVLLHQEPDTYCIPLLLSRYYMPSGPWRPNSYILLEEVAKLEGV